MIVQLLMTWESVDLHAQESPALGNQAQARNLTGFHPSIEAR